MGTAPFPEQTACLYWKSMKRVCVITACVSFSFYFSVSVSVSVSVSFSLSFSVSLSLYFTLFLSLSLTDSHFVWNPAARGGRRAAACILPVNRNSLRAWRERQGQAFAESFQVA